MGEPGTAFFENVKWAVSIDPVGKDFTDDQKKSVAGAVTLHVALINRFNGLTEATNNKEYFDALTPAAAKVIKDLRTTAIDDVKNGREPLEAPEKPKPHKAEHQGYPATHRYPHPPAQTQINR